MGAKATLLSRGSINAALHAVCDGDDAGAADRVMRLDSFVDGVLVPIAEHVS